MKPALLKRAGIGLAGTCLVSGAVMANSIALEEVVVTAQRKAESLQDAPISIAAFSSDALEKKGISNLVDLRANVPNLQLTPHPNSATTARVYMRGVGNNDDQVTQDPSVAVYMDGVYLARNLGLAQEVADIERIEVLRGPQGTLYGRNATGGAINVITKAPTPEAIEFSQKFSAGNFDYFRSKTSLSLPLGERLAAKLAYMTMQKDGFVDNAGSGVDRFGDRDRQAWRLDLLWDVSDAIEVRYAYDASKIEDTPMFVERVPLHPEEADRPERSSESVRGLKANDVTPSGHSLTAKWLLTDSLELKYIGAYRELDNFTHQNYHAGERGDHATFITEFDIEQDQTTHELQLLGNALDDRLDYVVGVYSFAESADSFDLTVVPEFDIDLTGDGINDARATINAKRDVTIDNKASAIFGQATYTPEWLESRLHLTVGWRSSRDSREATLRNVNQLSNIQPAGGLPFPTPTELVLADPEGRGDRDFRDSSPSFVVAYDLSETTNIYAKWVNGYKTGGYNVRASSVERFNAGFDAEHLVSTELGLKGEYLNRRLRLNMAVFAADYDDIQVNVQTDPNDPTVTDVLNAGEAIIEGVEMDLTALLGEATTLSFSYGYLDTDYEVVRDAEGNDVTAEFRFVNAPGHSATLGVDYSFTGIQFADTRLSVDYSWQDDKFTGSNIKDGRYIVDAHGLWNARFSMADIRALGGSIDVALWARNITDEEYYIAHFNALFPSAVFGDPETYGLDITYNF